MLKGKYGFHLLYNKKASPLIENAHWDLKTKQRRIVRHCIKCEEN